MIDEFAEKEQITIHRDANFRSTYIHNGQVFLADLCLCNLDLYFWYSEIDRRATSYDLLALKTLARATKVVRNPFRYEDALDNYTAFLRLRSAGVVTFISDYNVLRDVVEYIAGSGENLSDGPYLLERFYDNNISEWTSVTVMSGEVMYGYRKKEAKFVEMTAGIFKVYDDDEIGGEVEPCEVLEVHKELALKAAGILSIEIVGFDMIWHDGRPIIVDVNTFPGYYEELFAEAKRDPAEELFRVIRKGL